MTLRVADEAFVTLAQVRADDTNCPCVTPLYPSDADLQEIIDSVSDDLATVIGMRITGRQDVIARPCRLDDWCSCACCDRDAIPLGDERPVVTEVKINGTTLAADEYELHWNGISWVLHRNPTGTQLYPPHWPSYQRRWLADTEDNTFAIHYTQGIHVDKDIIVDAALEVICDRITDRKRTESLDGISSITIGGTTAVVSEDRLDRIRSGELGPKTRTMMGIMAPHGTTSSAVWAPELRQGWSLNLSLAP